MRPKERFWHAPIPVSHGGIQTTPDCPGKYPRNADDFQVTGSPAWIDSDRYNIDAKGRAVSCLQPRRARFRNVGAGENDGLCDLRAGAERRRSAWERFRHDPATSGACRPFSRARWWGIWSAFILSKERSAAALHSELVRRITNLQTY
jgi:hypothetical protein